MKMVLLLTAGIVNEENLKTINTNDNVSMGTYCGDRRIKRKIGNVWEKAIGLL